MNVVVVAALPQRFIEHDDGPIRSSALRTKLVNAFFRRVCCPVEQRSD